MYYDGKGVPQDYAEAVRWYRKSAEQGYAMAQIDVGFMYQEGKGVPQDYAEAVRWYRKAADQGDAKAQYDLGFMYYQGKGVLQDYTEARRWYRKAGEKGDTNAQRALGLMGEGASDAMKMRYLELSLAFLGGLWFSLDFLLPGRSLRDWRQATTTLLGIVLLSYVGLTLYGIAHDEMRRSAYSHAFYLAKWLLVGAVVTIVVNVILPAKKKQKRKD
jgi:hypothetical protein